MKLLKTINKIFQPPTIPLDWEKSRQAKVLHTLGLNILAMLWLILLVAVPFIYEEKFFSSMAIVSAMLICIIALVLVRKRKLETASVLITSGLWAVTTGLTYISGGIRSFHITFYMTTIVFAGILLDQRGSLRYAILSLLTLGVMALLEMSGYSFPRLFVFPPLSIWVMMALASMAILIPIRITIQSLAEILEQYKAELKKQSAAEAKANQQAKERSMLYEIGISIAKGGNLQDIVGGVYEQLKQFIPHDVFYLALYDNRSDLVSFPFFYVHNQTISLPQYSLNGMTGLTASIIRNRQSLYLPDVTSSEVEKTYQPLRHHKIKTLSFLGVPLMVNNNVIGVLSVQHQEADAYRPEQIGLFEALAVQIGIAVEKVQLIDQLQQELTERKRAEMEARAERDAAAQRRLLLEKVLEMGKQTAQITTLPDCLKKVYECVRYEIGFDRVGLFLLDEKNNTVRGVLGTQLDGSPTDNSWFFQDLRTSGIGWKKALSKPGGYYLCENYTATYQPSPEDEMYGVRQHLTVSAWAGDELVAAIAADNLTSGKPITEENIEALRLYAGYVGLTIRNARLNAELEQRVHERTAQLELAIHELESFSYSVGHDLRAPLRGMLGFSRIILDESQENLSQNARVNLKRIILAAQHMGELIDALLDFSRLTRAPLRRTKVNLSEMAQAILQKLAVRSPARKVYITIEPDMIAEVDKKMFEVVLENLLENAWKYTSKTENAEIVFGEQEINGKRTFFVRDNGAGFNMAHSNKLFGAFERLHRHDEFPGHGAGLATAQRIIHRHGGQIWGEGAVNQGATFYFTLD